MVYRAKCTEVLLEMKKDFDLSKYHVVSDAKDKYLEIPDEDLADIIESMNKAKSDYNKAHQEFLHYMLTHQSP